MDNVKIYTVARLILIRHAESEGNADNIMQGSRNYPLSKTGSLQAKRAADSIKSLAPAEVVSSPLSRAYDTAYTVFSRVDRVDDRLTERSAGSWEGVPRDVFEKKNPGALQDDLLRPNDFESELDVAQRMTKACMECLTSQGLSMLFTHGASMRILDKSLGGSGTRFNHLDALCLDGDLRVVGRIAFLPQGAI